jgi:hypothetical protein
MSVVEPADARAVRSGFVAWVSCFISSLVEKRRLTLEEELTSVMGRCRQFMEKGDCDAKTFERAAILLHRAARHEDEVAICAYVKQWAAWRERQYIFGKTMWLNARYKRIIAREARVWARLAKRN